ncbi:MAG: Holliday junction branch migration DNA helicase RuvB [Elusimicrobiales bacterium]|nr:Holliday junction branch migration DNA helicase RuvB [Elusimicrobiales bacterium]
MDYIYKNSIDKNEEMFEYSLRPKILSEFIGQSKVKDNLKVYIEAALKRKEPLDHCLFYAPPGLGKTTLAYIIANEMGVNIKVTSGPVLTKPGDLASILTTELSEGDVLFIDEIHRLNVAVEESIYPVMEDFNFYINTGKGVGSTTLKIKIPKITIIGATTRSGLLTSPLRDRFGIVENLSFYEIDEIVQIIKRSASLLKVKITNEGAIEIAKRSRGTPRIANRLLKRVRDFAEVKSNGVITDKIAIDSMNSMEIDEEGLDKIDRILLTVIAEKFNGGPVGVENIAVAISEEIDTITDVIEPYLIKAGFLKRTPRGRVLTKKACQHLGITTDRKIDENNFLF